jgi:small conductance mechanosensitive channel
MTAIQDFFDDISGDWGDEVLTTVAIVLAAVILLWVFRRGLRRWSNRVEERYASSGDHEKREQAQRLHTITDVLRIVMSLVVWVVVILTVMAVWGIPLGPLVTVGATLGVAVGFGAQDFVKDVIGGFFVLVEDQYAVGDVVSIGGVSGAVEAITLRTTVLRDLDGNVHHVPNGYVQVASNMTSMFSRVVVDVSVSYDTDLDRALAVIGDEANTMYGDPEWSETFLEEPVVLGVNELGGSSVDIRVLMTTVGEDQWAVKRTFLKRIKQRLDREGIEIPYQYINIVDAGTGG